MGTWAAANAGTITAVTSLAGTGLSIMQAQDNAKAQNAQSAQVNAQAEAQNKIINKTQVDSYAQLSRQGVEDRENQTMEGEALRREMIARTATARVAAAGSGISGLSVDAMLLDLSGKGLTAGATSETNYVRSVASREDQSAQLQNRTAGELSRVQYGKPKASVGAATYLGAGLQIANAGATYAKSKQVKI